MITPTTRWRSLILLPAAMGAVPLMAQGYDPSKYMSANELRRGMKGFGRTVLAGTEIITFEAEVISVMRNAFYPKQDVILIRCKGAGLEHSGIIGGMSGSPVYITDENGQNPRMIGAVAYGWTFNKDPVCGVQPIHQMLSIQGVTETRPAASRPATQASARRGRRSAATEDGNRYAGLFGSRSEATPATDAGPEAAAPGLQPLATPVMVSGASPRAMEFLRRQLADTGFEPVASGDFGDAAGPATRPVRLEPGSALAVPLMRGDSQMNAIGTCTEVLGDRALGFGHAFFSDGPVEMPMATGAIHTVIASVARSNKLGAAVEVVGTLLGDENTGIWGRVGPKPRMIPCDVVVREPDRVREFHYECVQHEFFTPMLLGMAVFDSVEAHTALPREHTLRYTVEMAFQDIGVFRSSNITSQNGEGPIAMDVFGPSEAMTNNEFGKAKTERVRVDITVEPVARLARLERAELARDRVKPGETLEVRVWWQLYRAPTTVKSYSLKLPDDLREGTYELTICSSREHARALRAEKPYLFRVESMKDMLDAMGYLAQFQDDHVYMRLSLPTGGLSLGREAMPQLPSFRQRILDDAKRSDVSRYTDALVVEHPAPFVVSGSRSFTVKVDKRADQ